MADTVPGGTSSAAALVLGSATAGSIDTVGDHDWYRMALQAGQIYTFTVDAPGAGILIDSILDLRDSQGLLIASDDDGGQERYSQLTFQAPTSGTYFLDVSGWEDSIGSFSVLAVNSAASGSDTIAANSATSVTLAIGANLNGRIDSNGDHDWYAVNLTAGEHYFLRTDHTGMSSNEVDTYLAVRDASGQLLADDSNPDGNFVSIAFTPTTSGIYYLDVEASANASIGNYNVRAAVSTHVSVHTGGPTIHLYFDEAGSASSVAATAFRAGVVQAASILSSTFSDNISLSFNINYGGTDAGAFAGPNHAVSESYADVVSALRSHADAGETMFDALPTSLSPTTEIDVWSAQARALGFIDAHDTSFIDGEATFSNNIPFGNLVGVAIHELTHAMGRVDGTNVDIFDMFRYTAPGTIITTGSVPAPPAYFSIDGGITTLAAYDGVNSPSDFLNSGVQGPNDLLNEFYHSATLQTLSTVDLLQLEALGFHLRPPNSAPVFTTEAPQTIATDEHTPITVTTIATDADNDLLTYITSNPSKGILSGSAGSYIYTPRADFSGADSFIVTVSDARGGVITQTVNITIQGLNEVPVITAPAAISTQGSDAKPIGLSVMDGDGGNDRLTVTLVAGHGTITLGAATGGATVTGNGSASVTITGAATNIGAALNGTTYASAGNFSGADTLTITAIDQAVPDAPPQTVTSTVAITVVAVPAKISPEFLINTQVEGPQENPTITGLSNGGFVVSWDAFDQAQDGSSTAIKAQIFNASGAKVGSEFRVNTQGADFQVNSTVTGLSNGGFVISWTTGDSTQDGSSDAIKAQIFNAGGAKVGGEFLVNTLAAATQDLPTIASLANGGFVISWFTTDPGQDGSDGAIKAQLFTATGAKVGSEFLVNTQAAGGQEDPSIAGLGNGGFVISWSTWDPTQDGSGAAVKAQLFEASGAKVGSEFLVNSQAANSQSSSAVAELSNGGFVVSWVNFDPAQGSVIKAQIFGASGAKVGSELLVSTLAANFQQSPTITGLNNGGFAVIWSTIEPTQFGGPINGGQIFDANGDKIGGEFFVGGQARVGPTVTNLTNSNFVVSWATYDLGADLGGDAIMAQIFTTSNLPALPVFAAGAFQAITTAEDVTTAVSAAATGTDNSALTWSIVAGPAHGTLTGSAGAYTYTPTANYNGPDSVVVKVADGTGQSATQTVNLTVSAVNDAPVNTVPAAQTTNQDAARVITGLSIADVDTGSGTLMVTLAVDHGKVVIGTASGSATIAGNNSASVTITGSLTDINATLAAANAVTYTPTPNYAGADTLHVTTNDNGNSGSGGALTDIDTVGITIVAANHAPVNIVPTAQTTDEDSFRVITGLSISDEDAGTGALTVTLAVDHGKITLGAASGAATIAGNNSASVTITGNLTDINATLAAASAVTYVPTPNYSGADTLHVTTNDNGNTGAGGSLSDIDSVAITVVAVNDAPVNTVPAAQTINQGVAKFITGLSVSDVDAGSGQLTVTLAVDHGKIALGPASGGAIITGNNSASVTLTGALTAINATLAAANAVTYTPSLGYNGADTLHFTTSDNGNGGSGGTLIDTDAVDLLPSTSVAQVHAGESVGVSGRWYVFGDSGSETITVGDHSVVTLRSGFNAGAMDSLRLTGQAADFTISASGSNAVLTSIVDDMNVTVPIGANGIKVIFDNDVVRMIAFISGSSFDVSPPQTVAGASNVGAISSTNAIAQVHAGESVGVSGRWNVFADSGMETITVGDHSNLIFRSGFNAGATDNLHLTGLSTNFNLPTLSGSNVVLTSSVDDIALTFPVGENGINIMFEDNVTRTVAVIDGHVAMTTMGIPGMVIIG